MNQVRNQHDDTARPRGQTVARTVSRTATGTWMQPGCIRMRRAVCGRGGARSPWFVSVWFGPVPGPAGLARPAASCRIRPFRHFAAVPPAASAHHFIPHTIPQPHHFMDARLIHLAQTALAVFLEALPFLVLGSLVSACMEVFVPRAWVERRGPRRWRWAFPCAAWPWARPCAPMRGAPRTFAGAAAGMTTRNTARQRARPRRCCRVLARCRRRAWPSFPPGANRPCRFLPPPPRRARRNCTGWPGT